MSEEKESKNLPKRLYRSEKDRVMGGIADYFKGTVDSERSRLILGALILVIGIIILMNNFITGFFHLLFKFWPIILIAGGIAILVGGSEEK